MPFTGRNDAVDVADEGAHVRAVKRNAANPHLGHDNGGGVQRIRADDLPRVGLLPPYDIRHLHRSPRIQRQAGRENGQKNKAIHDALL